MKKKNSNKNQYKIQRRPRDAAGGSVERFFPIPDTATP
jgi:hypothetical protein